MHCTRLAAAILGCVLSQGAFAQTEGKAWLNPPGQAIDLNERQVLEDNLFFEVVASRLPVAVHGDLQDVAAVALDTGRARFFTGPYFYCPRGLRPFLLRAVYGFGGTGRFDVSRIGKSVLIEHGSLGHSNPYNKSALVACLRDAPKAVYHIVSVSE